MLRATDSAISASNVTASPPERREGVGLLTGLAIGAPKPEGRNEGDMEERFLVHDPAGAELWIGDVIEVRSEGAVVVGSQRAGDEEPVLVAELLLDENADRGVLDQVLAREEAGGRRVDVLEPGRREPRARCAQEVDLATEILEPGRRG